MMSSMEYLPQDVGLTKFTADHKENKQKTEGRNWLEIELYEEEKAPESGTNTAILKSLPSIASIGNETISTHTNFVRKRKRQPNIWKQNIRKQRRENGQDYVNLKGNHMPERKLMPPCSKSCFHNCTTIFKEEDRIRIHSEFWKLSHQQKLCFYGKFVRQKSIDRKRIINSTKKLKTFAYYLQSFDQIVQVCKKFFLNTLSISERRIYYYFKHSHDSASCEVLQDFKNGKNAKRTPTEKIDDIKMHINSFPVVDSHYCRKSSKQYLEQQLNLSFHYDDGCVSDDTVANHNYEIKEEIYDEKAPESFYYDVDYLSDDSIGDHNYEIQENMQKTEARSWIEIELYEEEKEPESDTNTAILKNLPSITSIGNETVSTHTNLERKRKRPRKQNIIKQRRDSDQDYVNLKVNHMPERKLMPPCSKSCFHNCTTIFKEEDRIRIHSEFWKLSHQQMLSFYSKFVRQKSIGRKRIINSTKKLNTYAYYLQAFDKIVKVCKKFFLNTLSISERRIYYYFKHSHDSSCEVLQDFKKCKNAKRVTPTDKIDDIKRHINSFPIVDSHYCRKSSNQYLEQQLNLSKMFALYREQVEHSVSLSIYRNVFNNSFNLSFFKAKTDQCVRCSLFSNDDNPTIKAKKDYEEHIIEHDMLKSERDSDRRNTDPGTLIICFDMQSVFALPKGFASSFYYKRKLSVFNLTATVCISNSKEKKTYCAIWTELHSGRSGNDIACALIKILTAVIEDYPDTKHIILWSDSCVPQNKNRVNSTALLYFLNKNQSNIKTITQKCSEPGHSLIQEVDYVHSVIDRHLKDMEIHSPLMLIKLLESVKYPNVTLQILQMQPNDFVSYSKISDELNFKSMPFFKIKFIKYDSSNMYALEYKTSASENSWRSVSIVLKPKKGKLGNLGRLFSKQLSNTATKNLSSQKIQDIKDILPFLPSIDKQYMKSLLKI